MKKIIIALTLIIFAYLSYKSYRHYMYYLALKDAKNYIGKVIPEIKAKTLAGKSIDFKKLKDKKIVLIFWASWCKYCINEIDNIKEFVKEYKDIKIISISLDKDINLLKKIVKEKNINYPIIIDNANGKHLNITNKFKVVGVPSIWIIDKNGVIIAQNLRDMKSVQKILEAE